MSDIFSNFEPAEEVKEVARDYDNIKPFYASPHGHSRLFTATHNGKKVVLKTLKESFANDLQCREALKNEFEITSQLDHKFIRKAFGYENIQGLGDCVVFEYVNGKSLAEHIRVGTLNEKQIKSLLVDLCDALSYMHQRGVCHCDLKPENIIVTAEDCRVKIIDIGLDDFRQRIAKAFRRAGNKSLREYLDKKYDGGGACFKTLNIVPQRVLVSQLQVQQGLNLNDIIDTCNEIEELRLKNLTAALSDEEIADDRFVVEHFPLNMKYGFCRSRQSKVTIICPTSNVEVGIGWFTYYLALMGGFNYISKEIEADSNEPDSYFNYSPEPLYKGQPRSAYGEHDKEALAMLDKKQKLRTEFESDLKAVAQAEWVIVVAEQLKTPR